MTLTQLDITFIAAPTTSGPRPRAARDPDGAVKVRRDYAREWADYVEAHPEVAAEIEAAALASLASGAARISVAQIFEGERTKGHTLNASHRAPCADWLVERHPRLEPLIERRRRTA